MSMLDKVTKGKQTFPHLLLLYGPDGIGKSTFGSQAPDPIFLGPEKGTMNLDVARFPSPKNWEDVIAATDELINKTHGFKTLVIDTLDWLEPLCFDKVCKDYQTNSIEKAAGGYGKGYRDAFNHMVAFRDKLSFLREGKKMNIILLAHSKVTTFEDPTTEHGYNRYELKLQESNAVSIKAMWREYVDAVLFCNFEMFSTGEGKGARGVSTRERKMWTERDAAFDAKNRFYGMPFEMPLDFTVYNDFVKGAPKQEIFEDCDTVLNRICSKVIDNKDKFDLDLETKVNDSIDKARNDLTQLYAIESRVNQLIGVQNGRH